MTAAAFAAAFDAHAIARLQEDSNPFTLLQVRDELEKRLHSTGGRPSFGDAQEKWRVNILQDDVRKIRLISSKADSHQYKPSASQLATILIHMAISRFSPEEISDAVKHSTRQNS